MHRPKMVWLDMTIGSHQAEIDPLISEYFDVRFGSVPDQLDFELDVEPDEAFVFEFDYPDRPGLSILRSTKQRYPSIPILMLTMQHSERLAVWAYRNRVLDYLVTPITRVDMIRCRRWLHEIQQSDRRRRRRMITNCDMKIPIEVPVRQRSRDTRLAPALDFIQNNFRRKLRVAEVAERCGVSSFHFSHEFTDTYSLTFQAFLLRYRIFEACKELRHPNVPVANVAYSVGFNDPSYFARVFRRFLGASPSEFCCQVKEVGHDEILRDVLDRLELPEIEATRDYARQSAADEQHRTGRFAEY